MQDLRTFCSFTAQDLSAALKAWIGVDNKATEVFVSDPEKEYVEKMGGDWAKVAWNSARAAA